MGKPHLLRYASFTPCSAGRKPESREPMRCTPPHFGQTAACWRHLVCLWPLLNRIALARFGQKSASSARLTSGTAVARKKPLHTPAVSAMRYRAVRDRLTEILSVPATVSSRGEMDLLRLA